MAAMDALATGGQSDQAAEGLLVSLLPTTLAGTIKYKRLFIFCFLLGGGWVGGWAG